VIESPVIDLHLLGPVEAVREGSPLPLGGPRQRALLALLALEPGRAVSAGRLAEELWQGRPPPRAKDTLRSYVSRLRSALGPDVVATQGGGYAVTAAACRVDVRRFEQLLEQGRDALAAGSAGLAADRLRAALALWRGPALADVADDGALAREAQRLEELRLVCLEERIDADLALGRSEELVSELRGLVAETRIRERLWRQLVLALYRSNRQAEALAAYREARALLADELGLDPGPELRDLERAILRQEVAAVDRPESRHNVPEPTTSFVGREDALADVESLLREHRLVTLTGMGGTGKTRLAFEAARRQVAVRADGAMVVDLTPLADPQLVAGAVGEAVGVSDASHERLIDALLARMRALEILLVLDNCEHVVDACAELVAQLLAACPNMTVLATSRVALNVVGEIDYALDPLEPSTAARLFVERASAVRRDLVLDDEARSVIERICRELDGLPLAIELAAARAKALSLTEIAARLDDRFRFLRAWQRVADPRHRTLETTMDWSYELLSADEQQLLRRVSVFVGGAHLDAVAHVCADDDEEQAMLLLGRLVDASLVRADAGTAMRYRLLETVRQYAARRSTSDPDRDEIRRRHAEHYLRVAESANLSLDSLGKGPQRHELVLPEQHNVRAALDWAAEADVEIGLRLMLALENFWISQALVEGKRRYEQLVAKAEHVDPALLAPALRDFAACHDVLREFSEARTLYERSQDLYRLLGDDSAVAYLNYRLGIVAMHREPDRERALRLWRESLETFRRSGNRIGELQPLGDLGMVEFYDGNERRGREMVEASIEMAREVGWRWWQAEKLLKLAEALLDRGSAEDAEELARRAIPLALEIGHRQYLLLALALIARVASVRGDEQRALSLWASVEAVDDAPGRLGQFDRARYAGFMPAAPYPEPLPLPAAVTLALEG
jgi:predicted ATPase/DNA-binding SARP family transcriptional activator